MAISVKLWVTQCRLELGAASSMCGVTVMKSKIAVTATMLISSSIALAQMTPQQQQQLPPSDPSSSQYHSVYLPSLGEGDTVQRVKWEDRWGAFASSASDGWSGSVLNKKSKREAERAAMAECKKKGGADCRVDLSFYNQCGAVASGGGSLGYSNAPTEKRAIDAAMTECGNSDCEIFFHGCSLPVKVQ